MDVFPSATAHGCAADAASRARDFPAILAFRFISLPLSGTAPGPSAEPPDLGGRNNAEDTTSPERSQDYGADEILKSVGGSRGGGDGAETFRAAQTQGGWWSGRRSVRYRVDDGGWGVPSGTGQKSGGR